MNTIFSIGNILAAYLHLIILISKSWSLPQGAPTSVCRTMTPYHGGGIPPQTDATPFIVSTNTLQIGPNERLRVTITSPQGNQFQGFLLQARSDGSEQPIGRFTEWPSQGVKVLKCGAPEDAITHANTNKKKSLEFEWEAPAGFLGRVIFNATVAQDYSTFWVGVESTVIEVVNRGSKYTPSLAVTPLKPTVVTTTPNLNFENNVEVAKKTSSAFYNGCNINKSCFGFPAGCINTKNCKMAVASIVRGEQYEFELNAMNTAAYVAVGLSSDDKMGDDSVIECVRDQAGVKAYLSHTNSRPNLDAIRLPSKFQNYINLLNSSFVDGEIYCRVSREARSTVRGNKYDLINDKFYLLLASGSSVQGQKVNFHDIGYLASSESKSLADTSGFTPASKILLRLHGAFMLVAWIGTASLGILIARYFRQTWVGTQLCGKDHWFAWHRFLMVLTWTLTLAGFIIIFVELRDWSSEQNPHAILGVITTVICFFQPIGALFRPHPGSPKRPLFNWIHWLGGNSAHIIAIITIFFAVKLNKAELPEWMDWILVGFVTFHVLMHLVLSIFGCSSDRSAGHRVSSFPMKELNNSGRSSAIGETRLDAPNSCYRKFLLTIYMLVVTIIVVILVLIVVLAPIEEVWNV